MADTEFNVLDTTFLERPFKTNHKMIAFISFSGTVLGEYIFALDEAVAAKIIGIDFNGNINEKRKEMREEYSGFIKEVLNLSVNLSFDKLRERYGEMTFTTATVVYGEIDFPGVVSGSVMVQGDSGKMQCGFSLNLAKLKIGEKLTKTVEELKMLNEQLESKVLERTALLEKSNKELKEATAQLVQSAKLSAIGELSAGVAHELNQPLNGIKITSQGILKDIKRGCLNLKELDTDLEMIVGQVNKMAEIIDHMKIFTRSYDEMLTQPVNINEIIEESFKFIRQQLIHNNIDVVKNLEPGIPLIKGDPVRLEQVIIALLINAKHAVENLNKDGKFISVKTYTCRSGNLLKDHLQATVIEVQDNGEGVREDIQEKIFHPFFTTKAVGKGTGLGLSIAKGIIEKHGGVISVESIFGKGALFKIVLPVAKGTTEI